MLRNFAFALALPALAVAQSPLETTFANPAPGFVVTNTPSPITGLFDLTVTEPQGIVLTQVDMQTAVSHGTNGQFSVWMTAAGGTHVGAEQIAALWTQVGTATKVHAGGRVSYVFSTPIAIAAGTYGVAFHCIEANPIYHGGAVSPTLPQTYSNTEMTIDMTSMRVRISDPIDPFGGATLGFSPRQLAIGLYYVIGDTYCDFTATPTAGATPLNVQFTPIATSGAPGGILTYIWDFDNDGIPDSAVPNPSFTYTTCGTYSVNLQIVDANGVTSATKLDFIVTDVVTPSFTNEILAPNTLLFTDTSTPTPTAWAWHFDADGIIDSTPHNPVFVFANGCDEAIVSLTTTLACKPPVTLTRAIAVASSIETTFQGGLITTATALSSANFFDVNVANPKGITVCGIHVNSGLAAGTPLTVNLYETENTYVGKTGDVTLWRQVSTETVAAAGPGQRTFVPLTSPLHLAFGTFGIGMEHIGASPTYTNLGGPLVVSNADITITAGLSQGEPVFDPTATTFSPRIANIALHYSTTGATGVAGYGYIGSGCSGSLGVPTNISTTQPVLGGAATIVVNNLPASIGVMALGTVRSAPVDLGIIGMPGCPLFHNAVVLNTMIGAANSATVSFPIPNNLVFIGQQLYTQAASLDIGLNAFGFATSDAAVMLIGQ